MNDVYIWLLPLSSTLPRLAAADWLFLFAVKMMFCIAKRLF